MGRGGDDDAELKNFNSCKRREAAYVTMTLELKGGK